MVKNTPKSTDSIEPDKPASSEEDPHNAALVEANEINGARKSTLSKREIMDQLSLNRFPWEE
jgi:hypothetical protein